MNAGIRLFVAATLPEKFKLFLQEEVQSFRHPSVRLIPEQNLHLTLFFIGNTPLSNLETIKTTLQQVASQHAALTLHYLQTEPGPNPRSPRLVWGRFDQHPAFEKLSITLASKLSPEQANKQKPIPHITLARFKKDAVVKPSFPLKQPESNMSLVVDSISLWQSELASPHPVYSVLETYRLATKP